jgi:hypothetical protein
MKGSEIERGMATSGWMVKPAAKNETLVIALSQTLDNEEVEAIALDL